MNTTPEIKIPAGNSFSGKPTKAELLRLLYALDPQHSAKEAGKKARRIHAAKPGKRFSIARQSQITRDLLRRYFVLQVAQITGYAG